METLQDFQKTTLPHYEIISKNDPFWRLNNIDAVTKLPHLLTLQLDNNEVTISDSDTNSVCLKRIGSSMVLIHFYKIDWTKCCFSLKLETSKPAAAAFLLRVGG